jgi:TRAP-type C4-dicarboxylate transport system permease small subunit
MRKVLDRLYLWSGYVAGVFLIVIFLLMMLLSVGREINLNLASGDDFTAWSLVAMAFLGLAHTFKRGEMIRVGLLLERLSGRPKQIAEILSLAVATAFVSYFAWQAGRLAYDSWRFDDMSQGVIIVPLWIPQFGFVAGLVILLIAVIDELTIVLQGRRPTYEKEPAATPEELIERIASGGGV